MTCLFFFVVFNLGFKELEIIFFVVGGLGVFSFPFVLRELAVASWDKDECYGNREMLDDASRIVQSGLPYWQCFMWYKCTFCTFSLLWELCLLAQDCGKVAWETLSSGSSSLHYWKILMASEMRISRLSPRVLLCCWKTTLTSITA